MERWLLTTQLPSNGIPSCLMIVALSAMAPPLKHRASHGFVRATTHGSYG